MLRAMHLAAYPRLLCFNKPYGVLSQFTPEGRWQGLKDFIDIPKTATGKIQKFELRKHAGSASATAG